MIGFHKQVSIRQKIITNSTFTSGVVLVIAATTMPLSDYYKKRNAMVETTSMLADLVEINVGAALVFRDPEAAMEVLSELKAVPDVTSAFIYSADGELLAKYISNRPQHQNLQTQVQGNLYGYGQEQLSAVESQNYISAFTPKLLDLSAPLKVQDELVSMISIHVDLAPMITGFYLPVLHHHPMPMSIQPV